MEEELKEMLGKRPDELEGETLKLFKAIMKIADERDKLEEIEQIHRQENGELREQVKELEEDLTSVYLKGIYDERDKWIALVKEKIEEINKAYEDSKDENGESQYYYPDYTIRVLEELLEKRK